MPLVSGTRLGPYEIVSPLGAGGMGEVYRARDTRLDRTVAIKVLSSELVASPELKARFETEARAVSVDAPSSVLSALMATVRSPHLNSKRVSRGKRGRFPRCSIRISACCMT